MRDYALNRAYAIDEVRGQSVFGRVLRNWKARRRVVKLGDYDDHILRDIGVTREDVRWASNLPLTVNAALALEQRAFNRRRIQFEG